MNRKMRELEALKEDVIDKRLQESKKELMKLKATVATGTVPKSPGEIRRLKRQIARMLTIKNQRRKAKKHG
jgi:large subunit ribosomal protein L29